MDIGAIYVRVSTPGQVESGTAGGQEMQLEACNKIASEQGIEVPPEYIIMEQGSGAFLERPGLDQIRALAASNSITRVIAYDLDRIARDGVWLGLVLREFEEHKIELYTTKGLTGYSMTDELVNTILGWASKLEKEKIRARTMAGKITTAKQQNVLPVAGLIYGYDYHHRDKVNNTPQSRTINEYEAQVLRRMFAMALEGLGNNTIARRLNLEGILGKKGKPFTARTVGNTLRNVAYKGVTLYGKEKSKLGMHGKRERSWSKPEDILEIPGFTPAIIDTLTFDRVQEHLSRPRNSGKAIEPYLLSGLLVCSECGTRIGGSRMNKHYRYYTCRATSSNNFGPPTCKARRSRVEVIDAQLQTVIKKMAYDRAFLENCVGNRLTDETDESGLMAQLSARLDQLEREEEKYLNALTAAPSASKSITGKLEQAAKQKEAVKRELEKLMAPAPSNIEISIDEFQLELKKLLRKPLSVESWRKLLFRIGFRGEISSEKVLKANFFSVLGVNLNHHWTNMGNSSPNYDDLRLEFIISPKSPLS